MIQKSPEEQVAYIQGYLAALSYAESHPSKILAMLPVMAAQLEQAQSDVATKLRGPTGIHTSRYPKHSAVPKMVIHRRLGSNEYQAECPCGWHGIKQAYQSARISAEIHNNKLEEY